MGKTEGGQGLRGVCYNLGGHEVYFGKTWSIMFWSVETPDMLREKPRTSGMVLCVPIPPLIVCHHIKQYLRMEDVYR